MKKLVITIFLLIQYFIVYGQYGRFKGSDYVQVQLGFTDVGVMVAGRFIYNYENQLAGEFGIGVTHGNLADVKLTTVFTDGMGSFGIYDKGRAFYLNAQAGISLAGDFINDFQTDKLSKTYFFTYGIIGGFEGEFKLMRSLSFVLEGQQRYYFKQTFGEKTHWRFNASAGIRLSI